MGMLIYFLKPILCFSFFFNAEVSVDWDNVQVFIAVNRLGSIAKAAESLAVNHSTVLRRLKQLEEQLNVSLFNRSTRGYEITPAGEALLEQAVAMEDSALALQRQAASQKTESSGKLAITLPPTGSLDVMPILARFRKKYPHIELNLDAQLGLSDLNKLEAEVSIRFTNEPPEDYVGVKVLDMPHHLYASKAYLAKHDIQQLSDINDWVLISIPKMGDGFEAWVKEVNPSANIVARINSTELAAKAIDEGMGVTFLAEHMAQLYDLQRLPLEPFSYRLGVWLLTSKDLRFQPRVKAFISFMREQLPKRYPEYRVASLT